MSRSATGQKSSLENLALFCSLERARAYAYVVMGAPRYEHACNSSSDVVSSNVVSQAASACSNSGVRQQASGHRRRSAARLPHLARALSWAEGEGRNGFVKISDAVSWTGRADERGLGSKAQQGSGQQRPEKQRLRTLARRSLDNEGLDSEGLDRQTAYASQGLDEAPGDTDLRTFGRRGLDNEGLRQLTQAKVSTRFFGNTA